MIDRRELLFGIGGIAGGLASGVAVASQELDLADRRGFLTACIKMRGSVDDRLSMGWVDRDPVRGCGPPADPDDGADGGDVLALSADSRRRASRRDRWR